METEPTAAVDMSEQAVAERIATVGQLYRACMSLAAARPIDPAVKVEKSGTSLTRPLPNSRSPAGEGTRGGPERLMGVPARSV